MVEINPKYRQLIEAHVRKNAANSYEEDMARIAWLLLPLAQLALWIYIGTHEKFSPQIMRGLKVFMVFLVSCSLIMLDVVHVQHRAKCAEQIRQGEEHWIVTYIKSLATAYNQYFAVGGTIMWVCIYRAQIASYTANPLVGVTMTGQAIADLLGLNAFDSARDNDSMDEMVKGLLCRIFISFVIWLLVQIPACICFVERLFTSTTLALDVMHAFLIVSGWYICLVFVIEKFSGAPLRQNWNQFWRELKMNWRGFFPDAKPTISASAATAATTLDKSNMTIIKRVKPFAQVTGLLPTVKYTGRRAEPSMLNHLCKHCLINNVKKDKDEARKFIDEHLLAHNIHVDNEGRKDCLQQELTRVGLWGK